MPDEAAAAATPFTFDDLLARKRAPERDLPLCLDTRVADRFGAARLRVEGAKELVENTSGAARTEARRELAAAEEELAAVTAEAEGAVCVFRFRGIGRKPYDDLMAEHAPSDQQLRDAKKKGEDPPGHNPDTFPPALIAACCYEPAMTVDQVAQLFASPKWTGNDLIALWDYALAVNQDARVLDLGKGSGGTTT